MKSSFKKKHYSPSQFEEYVTCPRKYRFKRIDKIEEKSDPKNLNLEFGSSIHATIEHFYKNYINTQVSSSVLKKFFDDHFIETLRNNRKFVSGNMSEINALKDLGIHFLTEYCKTLARKRELIMSEQTLYYDLNGVPVENKIDVVFKGDEDFFDLIPVVIEDVKTSSKPYTENDILLGLQTKSYAYAFETNHPKYKVQGVQYTVLIKSTGKIQVVYMPLLEDWKEDFLSQVNDISRGIESGIFPKNPIPRNFKCNYCPFFEHCWKTSKGNALVKIT